MYREFDVLSVVTDIKTKAIIIEFSLDLDPETVSTKNLLLINRNTNSILPCTIESSKNKVYIELNDWPEPNVEHMLFIQKELKSIVGDSLRNSLQRALIFKSAITSVINIISPSHHEKLKDLNISWKESNEVISDSINSYRIDIAENNAFYNIVKSSLVENKNEILIEDVNNGQYYIRIRAEKSGEYGRWSEIVAFTKADISEEAEEIFEIDDEPSFEKNLEIINMPINGETPESFFIEFDEILDPSSIEEIVVMRRAF